MSGPQRAAGQTAISVSMSEDLLVRLDARAKALGLNRSQYIAQLARADLAARGAFTIQETSDANPDQTDATAAKGISYLADKSRKKP